MVGGGGVLTWHRYKARQPVSSGNGESRRGRGLKLGPEPGTSTRLPFPRPVAMAAFLLTLLGSRRPAALKTQTSPAKNQRVITSTGAQSFHEIRPHLCSQVTLHPSPLRRSDRKASSSSCRIWQGLRTPQSRQRRVKNKPAGQPAVSRGQR
ncbi:hypothetical protein AAFF_G00075860 [Aldrovandia affinis]|uniref:Uncharacterized protein n=1 Tax=Aldrovandia affinis TaxID=143900 RepID=A0AAD7RXZ6_9TELE|nr:hypothetical protein AAFF_G00075860 [Aldrovandia affinis]